MWQDALSIQEKTLGRDHLVVADTKLNISEVFRHQARFGEALAMCTDAQAIYVRVHGPEHLLVAKTYNM